MDNRYGNILENEVVKKRVGNARINSKLKQIKEKLLSNKEVTKEDLSELISYERPLEEKTFKSSVINLIKKNSEVGLKILIILMVSIPVLDKRSLRESQTFKSVCQNSEC